MKGISRLYDVSSKLSRLEADLRTAVNGAGFEVDKRNERIRSLERKVADLTRRNDNLSFDRDRFKEAYTELVEENEELRREVAATKAGTGVRHNGSGYPKLPNKVVKGSATLRPAPGFCQKDLEADDETLENTFTFPVL